MGTPEISIQDVQAVSSFDEVRRLFRKMGYDVSDPADQTAAGLGIAERVHHLIRRVERVAMERLVPGGPAGLEIYGFEVSSLTADLRKNIVNAFRNKPAPTLLLMTTPEYDPLDFVLVERALSAGRAFGGQVAVSHRLLSVDRRRPSRIHMRVLNRMRRNPELDPYAQHDRIRDAFRLAEWSQDEFNNRGLFSDYFLKERLPREAAFKSIWDTDLRPAHAGMRQAVHAAGEVANLDADAYMARFIGPVLDTLGLKAVAATGGDGRADYLLTCKESRTGQEPLAALLVYPWDRPLDRKDDQERDRAEDVPGIRVIKALEAHGLAWAVLTNGKDWRLYSAKAHSRASNYYEVELPGALEPDELGPFRYFYLFFRAEAFMSGEGGAAPGPAPCFLDRLLKGSTDFAKELGDRLRGHIFDEVFPYLAQGFVDFRKNARGERTTAGDPFLTEVYDATLTLLYRLLFLLYAESLDLLPVNEPAYAAVSLQRLKEEIKVWAGGDADSVEQRLKDRCTKVDTGLYDRLCELFAIINEGSRDHNVPTYNGGLFKTRPEDTDNSREAAAARFLRANKVPDFYLARAIDLLARGEDSRTHELVFIDYKALGVRQLGNIYEGLLMYHVVIPRDEWEKNYRRPGLKVALVPSNKERKNTGSYFTPEHIVEYIVAHTVGPLLAHKFETLTPIMRQAQREYAETREFERRRAEKMRRQAPRTDEDIARHVANKYESAVWDLFDLKVLDPAMGSGHFLVETVDFFTDKVLNFLAGFPWNPVQVLIESRIRRPILESLETQGVKINEDRLTDVNLIKRLVMKRCVYGVDLNPMAVELAKVSLWLDSFTLGAPLSFLNHHLRCGNSLIGSSIAELKDAVQASGSLFAIPMEPLERATANMEQIANLTDATITEVNRSAEVYEQVLKSVKGYHVLLNCLTAESFGVDGASQLVLEGGDLDLENWSSSLGKLPRSEQHTIQRAEEIGKNRLFHHWDIFFPDVFFNPRRQSSLRKFDAVIGNPPYMSAIEMSRELDAADKPYWKGKFRAATGAYDIYLLFFDLAVTLVRPNGLVSLITPNKWLSAPYDIGFRTQIIERLLLIELFDLSHVKVFDDPSVYPVVTLIRNETPAADRSYTFCVKRALPRQPLVCTELTSDLLITLPEYIWGHLLSDCLDLLLKMREKGERLDSWGTVNATSTAAEADEICPALSDGQAQDSEQYLRFVNPNFPDDTCGGVY